MLPTPVSFYSRRGEKLRSQRNTRDVLLARARVTNLGLLLLMSFCVLSFLFNLGYYFSSEPGMRGSGHPITPSSILATVERDKKLHSLDHLVMVPGHAIWTGAHSDRGLDEENWILEPYQKGGGRIAAFYNHIRRG